MVVGTLAVAAGALAAASYGVAVARGAPLAPWTSALLPHPVITIPNGPRVGYNLRYAPLVSFPGPADSNSPAFWENGQLIVFNSQEALWRSSGMDVTGLTDAEPITCETCSDAGGHWLEAIWHDDTTGVLYGWYHFEPLLFAPLLIPCLTAPLIGAAVSLDGGLTWEDRGTVLTNAYENACDDQNGFFSGGNGDFSVIVDPDGRFFYFVFTNYGGPVAQQGIGIARSSFAERGQPGTAVKYYEGAWNEPGLGGRVTPLFSTPTGWAGPYVDAFWGPSIHWNTFVHAYVVLLNRTVGPDMDWAQEGVYLTMSRDLAAWSTPVKLLAGDHWYPQVIGMGEDGTDTYAGQQARLFVGGVSQFILEFDAPEGS